MNVRSRRQFLRSTAALALAAAGGVRVARAMLQEPTALDASTAPATTSSSPTTTTTTPTTGPAAIDRKALVGRHAVTLKASDASTSLHVGNGDFAFGVDVTGLQTFAEAHAEHFPLATIANWAWHTAPAISDAATQPSSQPATAPAPAPAPSSGSRRASLARLSFVDARGDALAGDSISAIEQTLDLWTGSIRSRFTYGAEPVEVVTVAHPTRSLLSVRVDAEAIGRGTLGIRLCCEEGGTLGALELDRRGWRFARQLNDLRYVVRLRTASDGPQSSTPAGPNAFVLRGQHSRLELTVEFLPEGTRIAEELPSFEQVRDAAAAHWQAFWTEGSAIDFSGCTDPRAGELERRVILSQYLTAVHCGGQVAAPSSGLAFDRPTGQAQLDSAWWRVAHFAMWDRAPALDRTLAFYQRVLPAARAAARKRGLGGARWPRLCGPDGAEQSDEVGASMIWQQPHVIYFAEAAYRANRTRETLDRYAELVDETARYMAAYARADESGRFVLGPNLVPAQESYAYDRAHVLNPTLELAYWTWALGVAQKWRDRLGLPREEAWDRIQQKLSKPTVREGRYAAIETEPFLINGDHPSFLFALGLLPKTHLIDDDVMRETARWTRAKWKWNDAWGVDFPALAQTAARLGDGELAVDALLMESERNRYSIAGHNHPSDERPIDLSANGALLAAVALMSGGWDGLAPGDAIAPGFPKNGKWDVRVEGFGKVI